MFGLAGQAVAGAVAGTVSCLSLEKSKTGAATQSAKTTQSAKSHCSEMANERAAHDMKKGKTTHDTQETKDCCDSACRSDCLVMLQASQTSAALPSNPDFAAPIALGAVAYALLRFAGSAGMQASPEIKPPIIAA